MNNSFNTDLLGKTVNIRTLATGVLPTQLRSVKIMSILDPATAQSLDDVITRHAAITPYLTGWKPARYTDQNYVKIQHNNGNVEYFGTAWLDFSTAEIVTDEFVDIRLGSTSPEDMQRLRTVLMKAGFTDIRSITRGASAPVQPA